MMQVTLGMVFFRTVEDSVSLVGDTGRHLRGELIRGGKTYRSQVV
jgi:hypothetical protein